MSRNLDVDTICIFCFLYVHQESLYSFLDIYLVDKNCILELLIRFWMYTCSKLFQFPRGNQKRRKETKKRCFGGGTSPRRLRPVRTGTSGRFRMRPGRTGLSGRFRKADRPNLAKPDGPLFVFGKSGRSAFPISVRFWKTGRSAFENRTVRFFSGRAVDFPKIRTVEMPVLLA